MNAKFNILNLNKFDFISESLLETSRFQQKCLLLFFEYNEFKLYEELDQLCDIIENWYVDKFYMIATSTENYYNTSKVICINNKKRRFKLPTLANYTSYKRVLNYRNKS